MQYSLFDEAFVDNFAGGGGASTGIELAIGRPVDFAINHDPAAILMHQTNHPWTEHLRDSVWNIDPKKICSGRKVGLAWFSPDCKHFSKAKGAALVDKKIRGLAWIVLKWAGIVRPRVIMVENVEEFVTWGPVRKGKPVKKKTGQTFNKWKQQLTDLGYKIDDIKVFENDIAKVHLEIPYLPHQDKAIDDIGVVCFDTEDLRYYVVSNTGKKYALCYIKEIVGNIHDNPELLEREVGAI